MAARNPYQLDPLLAQGFSNLTSALIGDPQSDVYGARADLLRQQIEQSKASGRASDAAAGASGALARLRAAEAVGEKVQSDRMAALFAQVSPDNVHPLAETAFMNSMGFDGTIDQFGNVVENVDPDGPLMSVPLKGANGGNLTRTGMGTDTLMSLLVGDGTYEPDSMSNALTNLGDGRLSAMAKSMILNGTPAQQAAGMKMLFPQGGEYQDLEALASRLAKTIAGEEAIAGLNNDAAITISSNSDASNETQSAATDAANITIGQNSDQAGVEKSAATDATNITIGQNSDQAGVNKSAATDATNITIGQNSDQAGVNKSAATDASNITIGQNSDASNETQSAATDAANITMSSNTDASNETQSAATDAANITMSSNTDASNEGIAAAGGGSSDVIKITDSDDRALNLAVEQAMTAQGYDTDPENFPDKALAWFRNEVKKGPVLRFQRHENITQAKDEVTNSVGRPIKIDTTAFYDEVIFNSAILGLVETIMTDIPNIQDGIEQSSAMRVLTEGLGYNEKQAANILNYYLESLDSQGG